MGGWVGAEMDRCWVTPKILWLHHQKTVITHIKGIIKCVQWQSAGNGNMAPLIDYWFQINCTNRQMIGEVNGIGARKKVAQEGDEKDQSYLPIPVRAGGGDWPMNPSYVVTAFMSCNSCLIIAFNPIELITITQVLLILAPEGLKHHP